MDAREPGDKQRALAQVVERVLAAFHPQSGTILDELVISLTPQAVKSACQLARDDPELAFDYLRCLSVVDLGNTLQVVYHLYSTRHRHKMVIKVALPPGERRISSVTPLWPGADWHEREAYDLFGVTFEGHPKLKPLLLWEGFPGHPLLKSYPVSGLEEVPG